MNKEEPIYNEDNSGILHCFDCGIALLEILITETNESRREIGLRDAHAVFKVSDGSCPQCGGGSLPSKIFDGSTSIGVFSDNIRFIIEDTEIVDDLSIKDDVVYTTVKLEKRDNYAKSAN